MAALDLISEAASDAPVLLIVDDAQWLDRPTSHVLAFVARRIESDPIVLLAAIRGGYRSVFDEAGLPELSLAGLDDATAGALLDLSAPRLPRWRHEAPCCGRRPEIRSRCSSCRQWSARARTSEGSRMAYR
jgi:hypothetical protein